MTPLSQQISAVDTARRVIIGAAPKPNRSEAALLSERLLAAEKTLRWLEDNREAVRASLKGASK